MIPHFCSKNPPCAIAAVFVLLACCHGASSQAAGPASHRQFEPASFAVPAGNTCALHPEGNPDPAETLTVRADADGVVRFLAVRPDALGSVERLTLECTDDRGIYSTYTVDLHSEETFAPNPFDPVRAGLELRPALTGDPLRFSQEQLLSAGYGLRPDPAQDPDGYKQWLAAATAPIYQLRTSAHPVPGARHAREEVPIPFKAESGEPAAVPGPETVYLAPDNYWTGAILQGSYQKNSTASKTWGYVENGQTFYVPSITPGGYGTSQTSLTIWSGLDNVFQSIVDVEATSTTATYGIHRQNFYNGLPKGKSIDEQGVDFTPRAGDKILVNEWYCDANGNIHMAGGYGCTNVVDYTQNVSWTCNKSNGSNCQSYPMAASDLTNGALGWWADSIVEDDTKEVSGNCPSKTNCYDRWVDISPVTMTGSATVVQGANSNSKTVNTSTDPNVHLNTDVTGSTPAYNSEMHFLISLPSGGTEWSPVLNNIHYWNGSTFYDYQTPQGSSNAQPGVIYGCATSIAVGPNSRGLTSGTPWSTGCNAASDGNFSVYQMQTGGAWVRMQSDAATQLAVSPEGNAWALNKSGEILYWNGSKFVENAQGGCATSIGVGPNSRGLTDGTPWTTGCHAASDGNYAVYQMQTGGKWVEMQTDVAVKVAVSPEGNAWAINHAGEILYWNGSKFVQNSAGGCATSIGVGPNAFGLSLGTPWTTGCTAWGDQDFTVYQMQTGGKWVKMQIDAGTAVAVSPAGNAWTITVQ
jgi:hypothetical protein